MHRIRPAWGYPVILKRGLDHKADVIDHTPVSMAAGVFKF